MHRIDVEEVGLSVHPIPSSDGVIVRVQPPAKPNGPKLRHVPCDIVLVIDVSSSMGAPAPTKMNGEDGKPSSEHFGLSVMDLTKHAARTILSTLDEGDRLGIVTFSTNARIVQKLQPMTEKNKALAESRIEALAPDMMTNLWHGIQSGLSLFPSQQSTERVPAVMILTDGQPNHIFGALPTTLHTFGFGYDIKSGLLKSIAEVGRGNYAFIPDAGMIGTVFVHAIAHLQSTYATRCTLEITTPKSVNLRTTAGKTIDKQVREEETCNKITIDLGNLQYGQSRDIYLENVNGEGGKASFGAPSDEKLFIDAKLEYSRVGATESCAFAQQNLLAGADLPAAEIAYHQSRSRVCDFLSSLFPLRKDGEYQTRKEADPRRYKGDFDLLLASIPARNFDDEYNKSLMEDLVGESPSGQVSLALSNGEYFKKWGCHYFFSLWNAHAKQLCNSFKDPGPLMYNRNEFFAQCRDALDRAFDTLPPPTPSCSNFATTGLIDMTRLNRRYEPCFAASSTVAMDDGARKPILEVKRGSRVLTPAGTRAVAAVLYTPVSEIPMCRVGSLVVTPWHPVRASSGEWFFPAQPPCVYAEPQVVLYSGTIVSVLLEPDADSDAHAILVDGVWGVTLGHGLVRDSGDVRAHPFLGDYRKVVKAMAKLQPREEDGVAITGGVLRRDSDGLVCGFRPPDRPCLPGAREKMVAG
ncbi:hint-domain-containing protein [Durotheca rogersii]|uniref:hint-domain-containing protein n=1 Tax=Durotheca rogersii TaxID=419775 RepID=UPI002220712B|nr:hint-domain-containing protein [Durotheca rogersii]KAI5860913.1 hint-domain-containing protein [Durotheca rogersii]